MTVRTFHRLSISSQKRKSERSEHEAHGGGIVEFATEGPHPYPVSLPVCACVQFPYDSFRAFNDRIKYTRSCEHRVWTVLRQRSCGVLESETWSASSEFFFSGFYRFCANRLLMTNQWHQWLDFYGASITHRLFIEFWQYLMSNQLITHWLKQDKSD